GGKVAPERSPGDGPEGGGARRAGERGREQPLNWRKTAPIPGGPPLCLPRFDAAPYVGPAGLATVENSRFARRLCTRSCPHPNEECLHARAAEWDPERPGRDRPERRGQPERLQEGTPLRLSRPAPPGGPEQGGVRLVRDGGREEG